MDKTPHTWSPTVITRQAPWCQTMILGKHFSIIRSHSWKILMWHTHTHTHARTHERTHPLSVRPQTRLMKWLTLVFGLEIVKEKSHATALNRFLIFSKIILKVCLCAPLDIPSGAWNMPFSTEFFSCFYVYWIANFEIYEGCSNMNASSFITFFTYMLRQNGKRFFKGLYVTFKLAPNLKKNTVYLSSYSSLNEGHVSILTNSMLWTYTRDIDKYNSSIKGWKFLKFLRKYPHILI